jgi:two-component system chemotaxis response regulator CheY
MQDKAAPVLVTDDAKDMRLMLGRMLRNAGCSNISYASNAREAVAVCKKLNMHVAFLDIEMPGKNGIEAMKEILHSFPHCYCVIVSGNSDGASVRTALTSGARDYVVKPYSETKIGQVLARIR